MTNRHPPVQDFATDFDHTDAAWVADPYPIWDDLRQRCPVAHSDRYGGAWLPVTHDLVSEVAYDTEHFTSRSVVVSERRPGPEDLPAPIGVSPPISSDPPFHGVVRRMLLPAFTPKPIAALEPFTRELCRELLAATDGRASFDAALEYAQHIPVRVIVKFLGFPQEDADQFRGFIRLVLEEVDLPPEEREERFAAVDAYMDAQIEDHLRPAPGRPHLVPSGGRDRRPEAARGARPRHHGPADDRRDRHHLVGHRRLPVAPGPAPARTAVGWPPSRT